MDFAMRLYVAILVAMLTGCAGVQHKPIAVDGAFWQDRRAVIGVGSEKLPEPDAHMLGAQGLLDVAINRGNAGKLIEQLKRLNVERAVAIADNLAGALGRRGFKVQRLETIDPATFPEFKPEANPELYPVRDYRGLAGKGVERLLLVSVERIGTVRSYYGFIPTSSPRALFAVKGQLVDLKNNRLMWYDRQETTAAIAEPWDQEPDFPNVVAAVMKNMAEGAAQIERSLFAVPGAPAADPASAAIPPGQAAAPATAAPSPAAPAAAAPASLRGTATPNPAQRELRPRRSGRRWWETDG